METGAHAYILIEARMGEMGHIAEAAARMRNVSVAEMIGEYDLILTVRAKDAPSLDALVARARALPGVAYALTCTAEPSLQEA